MPQPNAFITVQQLVDALGEPTYMAIFDDANTGNRSTVDTSGGVYTVLRRAHAEVLSWLPAIYKTMPAEVPASSQVSNLLASAELDFACCLAYRRHPEYVRTYGAEPGGDLWKETTAKMRRIQESEQRIAPNDNPPETTPRNVGGFTVDDSARIVTTSADGTPNAGDY